MVLATGVGVIYLLGVKPKSKRRQQPARTAVVVEVTQPESHTGALEIRTTGVAAPYREVEVSAQVGGRIVSKSDDLRPGSYVTKGQELLRIDPADFDLDVSRLTAQMAKVDADLAKAAVDKQNALKLIEVAEKKVELHTRAVARAEKLKRSSTIAAAEYEAAVVELLAAQQALVTQENLVRQLDAAVKTLEVSRQLVTIQLRNATLARDRTVISAPCSGVIAATYVENNSHLEPGEHVALIDDTSRVEVRCSLLSEDLDYLAGPAASLPEKSDKLQAARW